MSEDQLVVSETDQDERLRFKILISEIFATLGGLSGEDIDREIEIDLGRIVEFLNLDRTSIWLWNDVQKELVLGYTWKGPDVPALPPKGFPGGSAYPWIFQQILRGDTIKYSSLDELPEEAAVDKETLRLYGPKSLVCMPIFSGRRLLGVFAFGSFTEREWSETILRWLQLVTQLFAGTLARKRTEEKLQQALNEVHTLTERLQQENIYLREEIRSTRGADRIIGKSKAMRRVLSSVDQVARTNSTVLLIGETGTGKEMIATAIHERSPRRNRAMVRVNCAAIPVTLLESELFGREKGAYTGALSKQVGRFELANGSTLFLDEVGELSNEMQVKLLRVLQEHEIERLGSPKSIPVDVRVIAASNRALEKDTGEGRFRQDLFYRLNVFPIRLPPLRERREDIPLLVWDFVDEFSSAIGKSIENIHPETMKALVNYSWPGNVRELRNLIERSMIISTGSVLRVDFPEISHSDSPASLSLQEVEAAHIRKVLEMTDWRIRGKNGAAQILQIKPTTLETRMAKLGIQRPKKP